MSAPLSFFARLRNAFITGLLLLAPLAITWLVFSWLVQQVGGRFRGAFFFYVPEAWLLNPSLTRLWDVLATLIVVLLVTALGYVSRYFLGRFFGSLAERAIQSIPGVNSVYNTVKQIVDTFGAQNRNLFRQVVLVQFPRAGVWSIGFLTNKTQAEPHAHIGTEVWTVFVPTAPNPTSGFLVMLPESEVVQLQMTVAEGMKMVLSGGAVVPAWPPVTVPVPPPPAV